jgi:hypothetical protein
MVDGPNVYLYCLNEPINIIDSWGLWVALGTRGIGGPLGYIGKHTVIIIHPDRPEEFACDPRFYKNSKGELEATLSANPRNGILTATPNDLNDRPGELEQMQRILDKRSDTQLINDIFGSADKYGNNLKYGATPSQSDDSYNSNSYTYGVLNDAGVTNIPNLNGWEPGADKPIPLN